MGKFKELAIEKQQNERDMRYFGHMLIYLTIGICIGVFLATINFIK